MSRRLSSRKLSSFHEPHKHDRRTRSKCDNSRRTTLSAQRLQTVAHHSSFEERAQPVDDQRRSALAHGHQFTAAGAGCNAAHRKPANSSAMATALSYARQSQGEGFYDRHVSWSRVLRSRTIYMLWFLTRCHRSAMRAVAMSDRTEPTASLRAWVACSAHDRRGLARPRHRGGAAPIPSGR